MSGGHGRSRLVADVPIRRRWSSGDSALMPCNRPATLATEWKLSHRRNELDLSVSYGRLCVAADMWIELMALSAVHCMLGAAMATRLGRTYVHVGCLEVPVVILNGWPSLKIEMGDEEECTANISPPADEKPEHWQAAARLYDFGRQGSWCEKCTKHLPLGRIRDTLRAATSPLGLVVR